MAASFTLACALPAASKVDQSAVYFRFKTELVYQDKPFVIDIVVGCGVKLTSYAAGGTSQELSGVSAVVYVTATPDGHAIGVQTIPQPAVINPCLGHTTANGKVPRDWLPMLVWFEQSDELARGIAYLTQDAYRNGHARFGFRGVTVESATKEEYEAFAKNGPKNLIPQYNADWLSRLPPPLPRDEKLLADIVKRPARAWAYTPPRTCTGVLRSRLNEAQRAEVRAVWPEGRPRFWAPADRVVWDHLRLGFHRTIPGLPDKMLYKQDPDPDNDSRVQVFPGSDDDSLVRANTETVKSRLSYWGALDGDFLNEKGMLYCDSGLIKDIKKLLWPEVPNDIDSKRTIYCRFAGHTVYVEPHNCHRMAYWAAFENDEYMITIIDTLRL